MHFDSAFKIQLYLPIIITCWISLIRHTTRAARRGGREKRNIKALVTYMDIITITLQLDSSV